MLKSFVSIEKNVENIFNVPEGCKKIIARALIYDNARFQCDSNFICGAGREGGKEQKHFVFDTVGDKKDGIGKMHTDEAREHSFSEFALYFFK